MNYAEIIIFFILCFFFWHQFIRITIPKCQRESPSERFKKLLIKQLYNEAKCQNLVPISIKIPEHSRYIKEQKYNLIKQKYIMAIKSNHNLFVIP